MTSSLGIDFVAAARALGERLPVPAGVDAEPESSGEMLYSSANIAPVSAILDRGWIGTGVGKPLVGFSFSADHAADLDAPRASLLFLIRAEFMVAGVFGRSRGRVNAAAPWLGVVLAEAESAAIRDGDAECDRFHVSWCGAGINWAILLSSTEDFAFVFAAVAAARALLSTGLETFALDLTSIGHRVMAFTAPRVAASC